MVLEALNEALDSLAACDPGTLADGETLATLETALARLEAVVAGAAARFEADGGHEADGARSALAWLATRTRRPRRGLRFQLRVGRALRELHVFEEAALAGAIGTDHVALVARLLRPATRAALGEAEPMLVEHARELTFSQFEKAVAYFAQLADPDGAEEAAADQRERRDAWLVPTYDGTFAGRMLLEPIGGAIVAGELGRLEAGAYQTDRAEAAAHLGREPGKDELARTPAQRRADALVEMARRSAALGADARFPAPLVSVLVDFPTLHGRVCELANGTIVTPGSLLGLLDGALVERAVWRSPTRVEVGAKTRLFSGATRRAIELRDRICQHPYCEEPAERCQVDHVVPASEGGATDQENGRLLCGFHNRLRNTRPELPDPPLRPGRTGMGADDSEIRARTWRWWASSEPRRDAQVTAAPSTGEERTLASTS